MAEAAGHAHEHDESELTLREVFLERAIRVGSMERPLQAITAAALLAIVASAVLVGLRDAGLPSVALGTEEGAQSAIPTLTFWLVVVLFAGAWAYVLTGLLHAHRLARLAALGVFTYGTWELWNAPYPLGSWRMAPSYVLLAAIWTVGLAALYEPPEERGDVRRLRLSVLPLLFLLVLGLELAFWWRTRPYHDPRFYTLAFFHQLEVTSFALIPVLLVAGVDFAEWGDAGATRLAALARRFRPGQTLPVLALDSAALVLAYFFVAGDLTRMGKGAGMALILLALLAALTAAARPRSARVPYAAVFASSLALMGMVLGISYSVTGASAAGLAKVVYKHPQKPEFQLEYPVSWTPRELPPEAGITFVVFTTPASDAQFYAIQVPEADLKVVSDPLAVFFKGTVEETAQDGPWKRLRLRIKKNEAVAWQRTDKEGMWLLVGVAAPKTFPTIERDFDEVKASWQPGVSEAEAAPQPEGKYTPADRAIEGATFGWIGLALVAAAVLLARRRRGAPGWLTASALFAFVAGVYWTLVQLPTLAYTLFGASSRDAWPQLTLRGLAVAVAGLTVLALLTRRGRALAAPLAGINLGLFAIYWLDRAIAGGIEAGRLSIVAAVLVLVALVWDIVMSGEAITNRHNRHFPRHTRVLVYLGYVLAVAAAVLFFSSIHTAAGSVEPLFESENFSDTGLLFLGTSLLVTLFALRVSRGRERAG